MRWSTVMLVLAGLLLAGCGGQPTPTPDLVATQIAVEEAAQATMTARAPSATNTSAPTDTATPTPTNTITPIPTDTNTPTPTMTPSPLPTDTPTLAPTNTPTATPTETWTPTPKPSPTATPKPAAPPTAVPKPVDTRPTLDQYKVYYSEFQGHSYKDLINYSVWSMHGDGTHKSRLLDHAQQPALSPDGTKLAYVHMASGIRVLDLTTGEDREAINSGAAKSPSFSPGAYRLAYAQYVVVAWWQVFGANSMVRLADANGDNVSEVVAGRRPAWSPTSGLLVYEGCTGTTCGLFVLNTDSGNIRLLVGRSAGKASWSPDGTKIAYLIDDDGDPELWVINIDGSGEQKLTDNQSADALAAWTPDGRYIYFLSNRREGWGIWVMDANGENQRRVTSVGVPPYWQWAKMTVGWNK